MKCIIRLHNNAIINKAIALEGLWMVNHNEWYGGLGLGRPLPYPFDLALLGGAQGQTGTYPGYAPILPLGGFRWLHESGNWVAFYPSPEGGEWYLAMNVKFKYVQCFVPNVDSVFQGLEYDSVNQCFRNHDGETVASVELYKTTTPDISPIVG